VNGTDIRAEGPAKDHRHEGRYALLFAARG
jgi:hypothetical protein